MKCTWLWFLTVSVLGSSVQLAHAQGFPANPPVVPNPTFGQDPYFPGNSPVVSPMSPVGPQPGPNFPVTSVPGVPQVQPQFGAGPVPQTATDNLRNPAPFTQTGPGPFPNEQPFGVNQPNARVANMPANAPGAFPGDSQPNPQNNLGELFEPGKKIAQVGDHYILYGEILGEINTIIEKEMPTASPTIKELRRQQLTKMMLPSLIRQKLVYAEFVRQLPEKAKIADINKSLEKAFRESELPRLMELYKAKSEAELDAKLRQNGNSIRTMRNIFTESQIARYYLKGKFEEERPIQHQEMLDYYKAHKSEYLIEERTKWEELMVMTVKFPSKEAAFQEIADMGNQVIFGASFEAVAKSRSQGVTASKGGQYDWTKRGALGDKSMEELLFTLPVGYLSDIIETKNGFHIIRVTERQSEQYVPFQEVQNQIKDKILEEDRKKDIEVFLSKLEKDTPIWTIFDDEKKDDSATKSNFTLPR